MGPTKETLEKPRREANPSNQDINSSEGVKTTHQNDVREAKKRGQSVKPGYQSIRGGQNYPTKATLEKPRREANPSNQDTNPSEGVKLTHQSDVREAKKRANPSNKDINPSEGANQPTKATSEKPRRGPIRQSRILIHQRWLTNPPKQSRRSPEERQSIKKDIDPSEVVNQSTKAKQEKPRGVPIHQKGY